MADVSYWAALLVVVAATTAFLYVATRLVTKQETLDGAYAARLVVAAFLVVFLAWLLAGYLPGDVLSTVVLFLIMVVVVRYVIIEEVGIGDEWVESLVVSLMTLIFLYIVEVILDLVGVHLNLLFLALA